MGGVKAMRKSARVTLLQNLKTDVEILESRVRTVQESLADEVHFEPALDVLDDLKSDIQFVIDAMKDNEFRQSQEVSRPSTNNSTRDAQ
jgi:hypothetical protein